jgi:DnaJ family protein A protein 5
LNHEQSRKHLQAVLKLREKLQAEEEVFNQLPKQETVKTPKKKGKKTTAPKEQAPTDIVVEQDASASLIEPMNHLNVKESKKNKKKKEDSLICNVCKEEFGSRNKLFEHIKETGHALAPQSNRKRK